MSKDRLTSYFRFIFLLLGLQIFTEAQVQNVDVKISVDSGARTATVKGQFVGGFRPLNERNFGFRREVAGEVGLASRIHDFELRAADGRLVSSRRLMAGEYLTDSDFEAWNYKVDLSPAKDRIVAAHSSWLGDGRGILMLDDILPIFSTRDQPVSSRITLNLPNGWSAFSADSRIDQKTLKVGDIRRSVIFIGAGLREIDVKARSGKLGLVLSGDWLFTDAEAVGMAREIFDEYARLLGPMPSETFQIAMMKFPEAESPGAWEAETRGHSVTIVSSDMAFKSQSLQRLHEQLRHEIFHLWFPNALNLTGDYAWFYEGFALYMSLKLGVKLNRIRFEDFLDTISRAHTIDSNSKPRLPLTDPAINPTSRYARGILVGFLADLVLLAENGGRDDVSKRLKKVFAWRPGGPWHIAQDEMVRTVITNPKLVSRYVEGKEIIEWTAELAVAGIESNTNGRTTVLTVNRKLNGRQKEILDRLGYNNWRKIGTKR